MRSHRCPGNGVGRAACGSTVIRVIIINSIMTVTMVVLGMITPTPEKDNLLSLFCRNLFQYWVMLRILFLLPEVKVNKLSTASDVFVCMKESDQKKIKMSRTSHAIPVSYVIVYRTRDHDVEVLVVILTTLCRK